jgi:hypothetical protein
MEGVLLDISRRFCMQKHITKIATKIHSSRGQTTKVLMTVGVYTALFLMLLHAGWVKQAEFLKAFSDAFLATWFLCGLLVLVLVLFLLKDMLQIFKELFVNTAESIYGSAVLITAFSLSGYFYSVPPSRKILLGHKTGFFVASIVYLLIAVYLKKAIVTMAETRALRDKTAFIILVCASFALTWFVKRG